MAATAVRADERTPGAIEVAPFAGGRFDSLTIEDPDAPGGSVSSKSALFGADVSYFLTTHVGVGALVLRQTVSLGPTGKQAEQSGTLAGGLIKYRWGLSRRTSIALVGAVGVASSRFVSAQAEATSHSTGMFALSGVALGISAGRGTAFEVGVREVVNRVARGANRAVDYDNGLMVTFGFAFWTRAGSPQ